MNDVRDMTRRDPYQRRPDDSLFARMQAMLNQDGRYKKICNEIDDIYFQRHSIPSPAGVPLTVIKSGLAPEVVDRLQGLFTADPSYKVPLKGVSKGGQTAATKLEDWLNAMVRQATYESGEDTWDLIIHDVLMYGVGACLVMIDPTPWKGMPPYQAPSELDTAEEAEAKFASNDRIEAWKKRNRVPILWRHVPGPSVHYMRDDNGLAEAFDITWRPCASIASSYPDSQFARTWGAQRVDSLETIEWAPVFRWANRRFAATGIAPLMMFQDDAPNGQSWSGEHSFLREPWEHGLENECPYVIIDGYVTGKRLPEERNLGVLHQVRQQIKDIDMLMSQKATAARMFAWPTPVLEMSAESPRTARGRPKGFKWRETEMIMLLPGEKLNFLLPEQGPDIDEMINLLYRNIDRLTLASVAYGQAGQGVTSGYAISQLMQAMAGKFAPLEKHMRNGYERIGRLFLKAVATLNMDVPVYDRVKGKGYISIGPEDVGDYPPQIEAKVKAEIEQDLNANAQAAIQLMQAGIWDIDLARDKVGVTDPSTVEQRIQIQRLLNSPQVQQVILDHTLAEVTEAVEEMNRPVTPPPAEIGGLTPDAAEAARQYALEAIQGGAPPIDPALLDSLPGGGMAGPPPGGAPNMNMPTPGMNRPPMPPPPNAGGAMQGPAQVPLPGGRVAGQSRRPTGPQRT